MGKLVLLREVAAVEREARRSIMVVMQQHGYRHPHRAVDGFSNFEFNSGG